MKVVEYWHGTIKNYIYDRDISVTLGNNCCVMNAIQHNYPSLIHCVRAFHILIFAQLLFRCHCYDCYKTNTITFATVTVTSILLCY